MDGTDCEKVVLVGVEARNWSAAYQTVEASNGAVVAGSPLASQAGLNALQAGGNAFDAAIAAAAVAAVTMPDMCGLGGDLIALVQRAGETPRSVIACGAFPEGYDLSVGLPVDGPLAGLPPAAPRGWSHIVERYGRHSFAQALERALRYAEDGFPAGFQLSVRARANADRLDRYPSSAIFRDLRPETSLRQPALAGTIRRLMTEGVEDLYTGALAEAFCQGVQAQGGVLRPADLRGTGVTEEPAISATFHGMTVWTAPPPCHGIALLQALELAERREREIGERPLPVAEAVRIIQGVLRLREEMLGDPRFVPVDLQQLLDPLYLDQALGTGRAAPPQRGETTFLAAVDREGNACALLQSVYTIFGSAFVEPRTGILLNNRVAGFSLREGSPNRPEPGKRPMHNMTPCLAMAPDGTRIAFGTPGGYAQVQANLQFVDLLLGQQVSIYEAVHAPRWVYGTLSSAGADEEVYLEPEIFAAQAETLRSAGFRVGQIHEPFDPQGQEVARWRTVGSIKAILRDPRTGALFAVADHRRHGHATGY